MYQLKAEVSKTSKHVDDIKAKYGEFKAPQVSRKLLPEHLKRKRKEAKILKNKGIEERNARDAEQMAKERATADKVKRKLEAKSRVYDAVQRGEEMDDYMRENCLVDFDGKPIDKSDRGREKTSRNDSIFFRRRTFVKFFKTPCPPKLHQRAWGHQTDIESYLKG